MNIYVKLREVFKETTLGLSLSLFSRRDKFLILAVLAIQIFLGLLDLAGIAIIGIVGSLAISGVSSNEVGNRVGKILDLLSLRSENLQTQVGVLGTFAAAFLILKSLISLYFSKRILVFLSRKSAVLSASLLRRYFGRNLQMVRNRSSQEVIYSCTSGVSAIMVGVVGAWINLLSDIALLTILGIGLVVIDSLIAFIVAITFTTVAFMLHQLMHKRVKNIGEFQASKSIQVNQKVQEALLSFREIFVRNRRGYYARSIGNLQYQMADKSAAMSFMTFVGKYVFEVTLVLSGIFISAIQFITQPAGRAISILAVFLAASARIMPAVLRIQQGLLRMKNNTGLAKPTITLINELRDTPFVSDSPNSFPTTHENFVGGIEMEQVSFSYNSEGRFHITDLDVTVKEGEFVAFVGSSGSGKTTTVDLILGILEPNKGKIRVSGSNPQDTVAKWPGAIAYVSQDSFLFDGSIKRNLALGFDESELEEGIYWRALERAHIADFVRSLPDRLDADIGERGTKLSGGQRQRIAIARAFMTNPKLLVLDEATSSLDSETEAAITDSLNEIKGSLTIITIAHRLSTILNADRIYYLQDGRVLGEGSFYELKDKLPEFRRQAELLGL